MKSRTPFQLPQDFYMGCSTASAQIEGGETNHSWYEWSIQEHHIVDGTNTLRANNHWMQYERDLDLICGLSIKDYRFSIEWSRIEPVEGKFDSEALLRYRQEIEQMISVGIRPLLTLHHFSNPIWFEKKGAFLSPDCVLLFRRYVMYVVSALQDIVNEFVTINEPNVYAVNGYVFGTWPPGIKSASACFHVMENMAKCHIATYQDIHGLYKDKDVRVGFANHYRVFVSYDHNPFHRLQAAIMSQLFQEKLTEAMSTGIFHFPLNGKREFRKGTYYDFIGINYYSRSAVHHFRADFLPDKPVNDLGWEIYPEGLAIIMHSLYRKYKAPIFITENGTCDARDSFRTSFIFDHLKIIADSGLPVERYYYWTLMDNFEWAEGESAPFGLIAYDFNKGIPTPRKSAQFYKEIIENRGVSQDLIDRYL